MKKIPLVTCVYIRRAAAVLLCQYISDFLNYVHTNTYMNIMATNRDICVTIVPKLK